MNSQDSATISAISTPPGAGGVALIRISGPEAHTLVGKIYQPAKRFGSWESQSPYQASYGQIHDEEDTPIDDVLVTRFNAPHSFTGEDIVEITCHGSTYIQQQILQLLIRQGSRLAQPGEYTQRAFLNGKMDLSQAEAVADLIASQNAATHHIALTQMRGGFTHELNTLRDQLLTFVSLIELELDFSEEEVEFANRQTLTTLAQNIYQTLAQLTQSFSIGNVVKNGIPVAIIGETNAGKSTLLNRLLNEERAIVSNIHGTTRDVIEDTMHIGGTLFRFIDTAGIRETNDTVETLGIERTYQKIEQATIVLWMIDPASSPRQTAALATQLTPLCSDKHLILLINKADQYSTYERSQLPSKYPYINAPKIVISAKENQGIDTLRDQLVATVQLPQTHPGDVIITNVRHYEALRNAQTAIERTLEGLAENRSGDLLSQDIREAMHYIGEITGQITTDEILGTIFSKFCIGK